MRVFRRALVVLAMLCIASGALVVGVATAASAKMQPIVECVFHDLGTDQYTAVFGYNNPDATTKTLAIGGSNNIAPKPEDRGQGTSFAPGRHTNTFIVTWDGTGDIAWNLDTLNAHAKKDSTACSSNPVPASGAQTVVWILVAAAALVVGTAFLGWRHRHTAMTARDR